MTRSSEKCQTCGADQFMDAIGADRCIRCHLYGCDCTCAGRGRELFEFFVSLVVRAA